MYSWYGNGLYDFTDKDGKTLPTGTEVLLTIDATVDYGTGGDHSIQIPMTVDITAPTMYGVQTQQLEDGTYRLDVPVRIGMLVDHKAIYMVGSGRLVHTADGFVLTGCDGQLNYTQKPLASYGLYADYFWYEIGDVICIGNRDALYYCFPEGDTPVAKARLATEELYKLCRARRKATVTEE
jgi:hypothetical protein